MAVAFRRRLLNAAVVVREDREVSRYARETEQSRETIYRDFRRVSRELEEGAHQREEQERRIRELEAENARLAKLAGVNPFEDPDKVAQYAAMAQAEGVSLPVARRLLTILQAPRPHR
jgi:DNA-directed RNA polymerase beta' subunit